MLLIYKLHMQYKDKQTVGTHKLILYSFTEKMTDLYSKKAGSLLNYFDCKKKSSSSESISSNSICQNVKSSHISEQSVTTKGQGHVNDFPEDDLDFMMDDEDWNEADFMEPDKKKFKI